MLKEGGDEIPVSALQSQQVLERASRLDQTNLSNALRCEAVKWV